MTTTAARLAAPRAALPDHLDRLTWSADQIRAHQERSLRDLLRVAIAGSPFHAERLAGVEPDGFTLDDLGALPTMTKAEMMGAYDDVVTDRRVTRAGVDAHLAAAGTDAEELAGELVVLASGGSSGERGVFVYPRAAAVDFMFGVVRPGIARTVAVLGEVPADPLPVAVVAAEKAVHATRVIPSLFGGDLLAPTGIPATLPIDEIVRRLHEASPLVLQGYPSVIRRLADERLAGRLDLSPVAVSTTSEPLPPDARERIGEAFGVGVSDVFGSSEGVLGCSPPDDPRIVLASDLAIVEPVDEAGRPVPPGIPSAKVLVTNLHNPLQPLIRYELTDSFVVHEPAPDHGHLRVTVEGRRDDEFVYGEVVVHPLAVRSVLVTCSEVSEYQVRQTATGIDVAVVAIGPVDEAAVSDRLLEALRSCGLPTATVVVRVVAPEAIARHPETGKTKRFVPLPG